jgi:hypothetical protein
MEITKDQLLAKVAEYEGSKAQHIAEANACAGAIGVCQQLIEILDTEKEEPTQKEPEGK